MSLRSGALPSVRTRHEPVLLPLPELPARAGAPFVASGTFAPSHKLPWVILGDGLPQHPEWR